MHRKYWSFQNSNIADSIVLNPGMSVVMDRGCLARKGRGRTTSKPLLPDSSVIHNWPQQAHTKGTPMGIMSCKGWLQALFYLAMNLPRLGTSATLHEITTANLVAITHPCRNCSQNYINALNEASHLSHNISVRASFEASKTPALM